MHVCDDHIDPCFPQEHLCSIDSGIFLTVMSKIPGMYKCPVNCCQLTCGETQKEEGMMVNTSVFPGQPVTWPGLCVRCTGKSTEGGEPGLTYKVDAWAPLLTPGWIHLQQDPWLRVQPTLRSPAVQHPLSWKDGYCGDTVSFHNFCKSHYGPLNCLVMLANNFSSGL